MYHGPSIIQPIASAMRRFKSADQAQRFLGPFGAIGDQFRTSRYRAAANTQRQLLVERRRTWRGGTATDRLTEHQSRPGRANSSRCRRLSTTTTALNLTAPAYELAVQ